MNAEQLITHMQANPNFAAEVARLFDDSMDLAQKPNDYSFVARIASRALVLGTMLQLYMMHRGSK